MNLYKILYSHTNNNVYNFDYTFYINSTAKEEVLKALCNYQLTFIPYPPPNVSEAISDYQLNLITYYPANNAFYLNYANVYTFLENISTCHPLVF